MEIRYGNVYMTITDLEKKLPVYLTCVGKWSNQYPLERADGFPDYQWIQCTSGQGILEMNGQKYTVEAGQGMLLFPDVPHRYYPQIEPWEVRWMAFNGTYVGEMLRSLEFNSSRIITVASPDPLLKHLYELHTTAHSTEPLKSVKCSSIIYTVIVDLYRYGTNVDLRSKQQYFDQLSPALRFIESHYNEAITLNDLASRLSVSPQHTCVLFQMTLGLRPFEYITGVRLSKAKELLHREPNLDIGELAGRVGYESTSYFIKVFKRIEGVTPGDFRKRFHNRRE